MNEISLEAQGRWHSILAGFMDARYLNGKHHDCPICMAGKDRFRFTDHDGKGYYICNQCGSGDGFELLQRLNHWDFKTAAAEVRKLLPQSSVKLARKRDPKILLRKIAQGCFDGDEVEKYLTGRGLNHFPGLRQCQLDYYTDNGKLRAFPAMVGLIVDVQNNPVSYHVTYLDGGKKASVDSPKKIMPGVKSITGCAVRLGQDLNHICVTEGIETGLAVRQQTGLTVWSALNAGNMEKLDVPEKTRQVDIYADNDLNFTGHKAAYILANRLSLAGVKVTVNIPKKRGTDFADEFTEAQ